MPHRAFPCVPAPAVPLSPFRSSSFPLQILSFALTQAFAVAARRWIAGLCLESRAAREKDCYRPVAVPRTAIPATQRSLSFFPLFQMDLSTHAHTYTQHSRALSFSLPIHPTCPLSRGPPNTPLLTHAFSTLAPSLAHHSNTFLYFLSPPPSPFTSTRSYHLLPPVSNRMHLAIRHMYATRNQAKKKTKK